MKITHGFSDGIRTSFKALPYMIQNKMLIWFLPAFFLTLALSYGAFALIDMAVDSADRLYMDTFGGHSLDVCGEGMIVIDCIEEVFRQSSPLRSARSGLAAARSIRALERARVHVAVLAAASVRIRSQPRRHR